MKQLFILFSLTICVLAGSSFYSSSPEKISSLNDLNVTDTIEINLSDLDVKEVSPFLFGFSVENLYTEISNPYDTALIKSIKALRPKVLRWPGGNSSNYVHALERGYGYAKSQVQGTNIRTALKMERQGLFNLSSEAERPYIQDFIELAKLTGAKVLLVANIVTGTPEECIQQINYFKEFGVEVIGVEIGNELYLSDIRTVFRYPGSYMLKANQFVAALRKYSPGIKLAACAAPYNRTGDAASTSGEISFYTSWNDAIARDNVFDAISLHYFLPVTVKAEVPVDSVFRIAAKDLVRLYSPGGLINHSMEYYAETFPNNKIWMTEWNIAPVTTKNYYLNTLFQGIYAQAFLHYLNGFNALHNNAVEIASFNMLVTGGRSGSNGVITVKQEKEKLSETFIKRAAYFSFLNMQELYSSNYVPMKLNSNTKDESLIYAYRDTVAKNIAVYWCNFSGKDISVSNFIVGADTLGTADSVSVKSFYGNLSSSYGFSAFSRTNTNVPPAEENKEMLLSQLRMRGNSYGYFKMKQ